MNVKKDLRRFPDSCSDEAGSRGSCSWRNRTIELEGSISQNNFDGDYNRRLDHFTNMEYTIKLYGSVAVKIGCWNWHLNFRILDPSRGLWPRWTGGRRTSTTCSSTISSSCSDEATTENKIEDLSIAWCKVRVSWFFFLYRFPSLFDTIFKLLFL